MIYIITKNGQDYAQYHNSNEAVSDLELHRDTEPDTFELLELSDADFNENIKRPMYA